MRAVAGHHCPAKADVQTLQPNSIVMTHHDGSTSEEHIVSAITTDSQEASSHKVQVAGRRTGCGTTSAFRVSLCQQPRSDPGQRGSLAGIPANGVGLLEKSRQFCGRSGRLGG